MKKIAFIIAALLVVLPTTSFAALEDSQMESGLIFLDLPALSMVHHDEATKKITSFTGVNVGLGITHRQFFKPVVADAWNPHWDIGTILLILPYVGIGTDYVWSNGWYVGVGLFYIIPEIHAGVYF